MTRFYFTYLSEDPVVHSSHILRTWGLGLQGRNSGRTQLIPPQELLCLCHVKWAKVSCVPTVCPQGRERVCQCVVRRRRVGSSLLSTSPALASFRDGPVLPSDRCQSCVGMRFSQGWRVSRHLPETCMARRCDRHILRCCNPWVPGVCWPRAKAFPG